MEMKKSISDTERALRSYGAVSETAWTTDKGEPRASKQLMMGCASIKLQPRLILGCLFIYLFFVVHEER